jgi:hypothetical protein
MHGERAKQAGSFVAIYFQANECTLFGGALLLHHHDHHHRAARREQMRRAAN